MKQKYLLFGILILLIMGLVLISLHIILLKDNTTNPLEQTTITNKNITNYNFESNWWLKPQTFGMFNYYIQTNYTLLKITNCTVNGYRLAYNLNEFNYKKDIEKAHKNNIKYVLGMLFDITKNETVNNSNPFQKCLSYNMIKRSSLQKAKKIIDLGVDGLVIIHPFGDHFFIDNGVSCLCPSNLNNSQKYQLGCATNFYHKFVREIKDYAKLNGKNGFPVAIASHGEWLVPFTINMLPSSNFAYINLDQIEDSPHAYEYKLHSSATNSSLVASASDISFGWLMENSKKPQDLIRILMAEAYANKGTFQDQYGAGLSPMCVAQGKPFADNCWLDKSVNADTIEKINSFYLANKDLFNFNSKSFAKIGILFSAKSIENSESKHWIVFKKLSKILSIGHYQYDVLFSKNSDFSKNTITLKKLLRYKTIILPDNKKIDKNVAHLINEYLLKGGKIITIGKIDPKLIIPKKSSYVIINQQLDLWENSGIGWNEFKKAIMNKGLFSSDGLFYNIDSIIGKKNSEDTLPKDVGIQVWFDKNKTIIHLVNYDFDLKNGIMEKDNINVSINLPYKERPSTIEIISPDFKGKQNLRFDYINGKIQFTIPKLKAWDVLVIK